jgi:hypothetical protein
MTAAANTGTERTMDSNRISIIRMNFIDVLAPGLGVWDGTILLNPSLFKRKSVRESLSRFLEFP